MKNLFACSFMLSLLICVVAGVEGAQRRGRRVVKKDAGSEHSAKSNRSDSSEGTTTVDKDALAMSFVADFDFFTAEVVRRIETAANPAQGVNRAQKYLEARRPVLKAKYEALKCISEREVRPETMKYFTDHFFNDGVKIGQLQVTYAANPVVLAKIKKLTADYLEILVIKPPCPEQETPGGSKALTSSEI